MPVLEDLPWLEIKLTSTLLTLPPGVRLGFGEAEVLSLAMESPGCLVVIDDRLARQYARQLRIRLTGTLGVLLEAKRRKLIPAIRPVIDDLSRLGFRLHPRTHEAVLRLAKESIG